MLSDIEKSRKTNDYKDDHSLQIHNREHRHFINMVLQQPIADVAEVKHGHWIYNEKEECYVCSECGMSALNNYRGLSVASNGCPHCLAKMDGPTTIL